METVHSLSIYAHKRKSERSERKARSGGGWGLRVKLARRIERL